MAHAYLTGNRRLTGRPGVSRTDDPAVDIIAACSRPARRPMAGWR